MNRVLEAAKAVLAAFERDAKTEYQRWCERELRLAIAEVEVPGATRQPDGDPGGECS